MYKISVNVLTRRLKVVLPKIIDEKQSDFVVGRNMLDSVLVASEVMDDVKRRKQSYPVFKVDFEKAYDCVRWNFLL